MASLFKLSFFRLKFQVNYYAYSLLQQRVRSHTTQGKFGFDHHRKSIVLQEQHHNTKEHKICYKPCRVCKTLVINPTIPTPTSLQGFYKAFTRLTQTPPEPAIFSSADEHYIREALGSIQQIIVVGFERDCSVEGVRKILYFGDRKR